MDAHSYIALVLQMLRRGGDANSSKRSLCLGEAIAKSSPIRSQMSAVSRCRSPISTFEVVAREVVTILIGRRAWIRGGGGAGLELLPITTSNFLNPSCA